MLLNNKKMTKQELNQALEFINSPQGELQIIIYASLDNEVEPRKLDISGTDLPALRQLFIESIRSSIVSKVDHTIMPISTADERKRCFYLYDLELPAELGLLEEAIGNDDLINFSFASNSFSDIESLIIVIADNENELALYKKLYSVEIIGKGGGVFWHNNERLKRFDDQLLRISPKFQAIRVADQVVIIDLDEIEKSFGFHDVIKREATKSIEVIKGLSLVKNISSLEDLVGNISFARKLTKVAKSSPVLRLNIPNANIISFSKSNPKTRNRMRYNEDGTQFILDTRISKDLLIKILNDDLLTSELTKLYYDSLAKDGIEVEDSQSESNPESDN